MTSEIFLRFAPTDVVGVPDVSEVCCFPDRLELCSAGRWLTFPFLDMVRWPWPARLWRSIRRVGWRGAPLMVGERDWFHPPGRRFFRFFTTPPIVIFIPDDPAAGYTSTVFRRVQDVMSRCGFGTFDLG